MRNEPYSLAVGKEDEERLTILNEIHNPLSQPFLLQAGLQPGMRVLEVGCGTGIMLNWLAEQVGPDGYVLGVDSSVEQLKIAERNAEKQGLKQIEHKHISVFELDRITEQFDFAYTRFVLLHLNEPALALAKIYDRLVPGGIIACDCGISSHMFSDPYSKSYERYTKLLQQLFLAQGKDASLGKQIQTLLRSTGFTHIRQTVVQPILRTEREKSLVTRSLTSFRKAMLQYALMTSDELELLLHELELECQHKEMLWGGMALSQVTARR